MKALGGPVRPGRGAEKPRSVPPHPPLHGARAIHWGRLAVLCVVGLAGVGQGCTPEGVDARRRIDVGGGVGIDVWVIKSRPGTDGERPRDRGITAVLLHPLLTDKGWFLPLGRRLAADGWDVVLPDLRGHGDSGGRVTWGAMEKHDVVKVIDALVGEKLIRPRVYAMGASLGACVAVQYAAVEPACRGVLALAPPTGVRGYVRCAWPLGTDEFIDARVRAESERGGYDSGEASAVEAAKKLKCPLIVVHGRLDTTVPYEQSKAVFDAAPRPKKMIRLWTDHGGVQMWRDEWLARQMATLPEMAGKTPQTRTSTGTGANDRGS